MMPMLMPFVAGLTFGLGLILSGMTDPAKVLGFLDLAGNWDPSLAFVMAGAILAGSMAFHLASGRATTWLGETMRLPTATRIDRRLILGSLTFGIGWGMAGYCPGPALVSVAQGGAKPLLFFGAMLAGMAVYELLEHAAGSRSRKAR